jgi:seryl-tRNA synthetase
MAKQQKTRYADFFTEFVALDAKLEASAGEIEHLEKPRQALKALIGEITALNTEQSLHSANRQQVTQRLQAAMDEGKKLVTFLRVGLKQHFGNRNEKLVEFGIQPFRSRTPEAVTPKPPAVEGSAPAEPKPSEPQKPES